MNTIADYRESIRKKYNSEGKASDYGLSVNPVPTDFRRRALWLLDDNLSPADRQILDRFFEIRPGDNAYRKIEEFKPSLYRPLQSLFTDPEKKSEDEAMLDFGALVINFTPRPYRKFRSEISGGQGIDEDVENKNIVEGKQSEQDGREDEVHLDSDNEEKSEVKEKDPEYIPIVVLSDEAKAQNHKQIQDIDPSWWERNKVKVLAIAGIVILFGTVLYGYVSRSHDLQCMQWQIDHYEKVKCEAQQGIGNPINPIDTAQFKIRRIPVSKTTTFFIKGKAIVWYARNNGYEFYDHPGYHPLLGKEKELKEVSTGIAESVRNGAIKANY